ncbi:hypothetical protein AST00_01260 [Staphylococcus equorum]|nr:hypothetical protein AST01_03065 [Staphylococcus equorum]OEK72119.1 hypothetical protein AST00_01260 [Staphylococcus equorum]
MKWFIFSIKLILSITMFALMYWQLDKDLNIAFIVCYIIFIFIIMFLDSKLKKKGKSYYEKN